MLYLLYLLCRCATLHDAIHRGIDFERDYASSVLLHAAALLQEQLLD